MATLYLLRHAKAGWALPGVRDFDRPLDETGHRDSEEMGEVMAVNGYVPDLTLCSGALRARQTLAGIAARSDTGKVIFSDVLYMTDAAGYLDLIREHGNASALLIIGHNPMMEDLALAVSGDGDEAAKASLNAGFSTAGLAVISFENGLDKAAPGKGRLDAYIMPGD
ncbi:MAG: histidine phosphatase family protein [Rhizobiaceae bacterium]|nr:histidine phosphatase family protein [Rhizobiaceae bacterium]